VSGRTYLLVYLSTGGCPNGVTVSLDAGAGNPHGIGASVTSYTNGTAVTQYMLPSGSFGQSATEIYVGMGPTSAVDLTITWPDGSVEERPGVRPGPLHLTQ
jgi:hypothetical protein